jgi:hypothetical protein
MTTVGFDGKARRKRPADRAWLATSFAVNCAYWLAVYFFVIEPKVLDDTTEQGLWWFGLLAASFLLPMVISFFFRVPDRLPGTWRFIWYRGGVMNLLAFAVLLAVMAILSRPT